MDAWLAKQANIHDFSFKPTSIGIALVGKHGTCTKIIAKFPLPEIK